MINNTKIIHIDLQGGYCQHRGRHGDPRAICGQEREAGNTGVREQMARHSEYSYLYLGTWGLENSWLVTVSTTTYIWEHRG